MARMATQSTLDSLYRLTIKEYLAETDRLDSFKTVQTPCNFGGYRHWFICDCGKRAGVLYFRHKWACRHCIGLPYQSQLNQPFDRLNERLNRIRGRLGWVRGVANGKGEKPKGMHQRTFTRLSEQHEKITSQLLQTIRL